MSVSRGCFLGAALSILTACAPIDDVGALDVLSRPPPAAGATVGDAGIDTVNVEPRADGGAPGADVVEPRDALTTCKMQSVACTVCMSMAQCLPEWGECGADVPCLAALPVVRSCNCEAQMFDAGSIARCGQDFQAVSEPAAHLGACIVASCAVDCGI